MLEITFRNGDVRTYDIGSYTDYRYFGSVFVVIYENQWIGIYAMEEIRMIECSSYRKKCNEE